MLEVDVKKKSVIKINVSEHIYPSPPYWIDYLNKLHPKILNFLGNQLKASAKLEDNKDGNKLNLNMLKASAKLKTNKDGNTFLFCCLFSFYLLLSLILFNLLIHCINIYFSSPQTHCMYDITNCLYSITQQPLVLLALFIMDIIVHIYYCCSHINVAVNILFLYHVLLYIYLVL